MSLYLDAIKRIDKLPALPAAAIRLTELLTEEETELRDVVEVIKFEPGMTANILKMANSAFYAAAHEIGSLQNAISRLGTNEVLRIAVVSSFQNALNHDIAGYALTPGELWRHSVACALLSQTLADKYDVSEGEVLFTSALLHDIGKILLGNYLDVDFAAIEAAAKAKNLTFDEAEREVIGFDHAEIGARLLEQWRLPKKITDAIHWHLNPERGESESIVTDLLHISDFLVVFAEIGVGRDGLYYRPRSEVLERRGISNSIDESVLPEMLERLEAYLGICPAGATEVRKAV